MNPVDRLQALIRHPDYRRLAGLPYAQMLKIGLHNFILENCLRPIPASHAEKMEGIVFLRSWGLNSAVDPKDPEQTAAVLDALRAGNVSVFRGDLRVREASEHKDKIDPHPGRFYNINIWTDLECPTSELLTVVAKMANEERKRRGIKVKRAKPHGVDPWTVWDKKQAPGNTLLKITRTLCHVRGNPAYDPETKRAYEQVTRAYKKAGDMIKEVRASRNKALTEEDAMVAFVVKTSVAVVHLAAQLFPPGPAQRIPFAPSPRQLARMTTKWKAWLKSELAKA